MSEIKNLLAKMINKINSNEDRIENIEENGVGGGVSSWNDLTDKPFYSEVTEVVTNVLEWDGNTDGLVSVAFNSNLIFYKISDVIPKKNDLIGGSIYFRPISNPDKGENSLEITDDLVMTETEDILVLSEGLAVVVKKSGATFQNIPFEEVGVYFIVMTNNDVYSSKLEATSDIFTVTNEVVHKLDPKYLPEGYPYVEEGEMVEILPETQAIDGGEDGFVLMDAINGVEVGDKCTVKYNGVIYECVSQSSDVDGIPVVILGNGVVFGLNDTGEPFGILIIPSDLVEAMGAGAVVIPLDGATTVTIAISSQSATIHKLDPKYINDEWLNNKLNEVKMEAIAYVDSKEAIPEFNLTNYLNFSSANETFQLLLTQSVAFGDSDRYLSFVDAVKSKRLVRILYKLDEMVTSVITHPIIEDTTNIININYMVNGVVDFEEKIRVVMINVNGSGSVSMNVKTLCFSA